MTDEEINKLALKITANVATKEDIQSLKQDLGRLEDKMDTILELAEGTEEEVQAHEKRLKYIERIPAIAHELKSK